MLMLVKKNLPRLLKTLQIFSSLKHYIQFLDVE